MTQYLHDQIPTARLTETDYETLMLHLGEQIAEQIARDCPEGEAAKTATDALANTFGTSEDQTVLDWRKAAAQKVGADWRACVGI